VAGTPLQGKCAPFLLKKYDGITFGFFSLMTEDFPFVTSGAPVHLKVDNITMAKRVVALLRSKGANVIIALTHVGTKKDREIATKVPGIDIIFGGHSHHYLRKLLVVGNTVIVNGGERGTHLVKLDFFVSPEKKLLPEKTLYTLIPINNTLEPDPAVEALLASFRKQLPPAIILGTTNKPWDLSKKAVRLSESGVADLINNLMRKKFKVDIVLNNSGAFRGKKVYPPGKITDTMPKEIDEFRNYAYTLNMKGKYIREILEHSASSYGRGGFMQVSGLRYVIDIARPKQILGKDENGHLKIVTPGHRVVKIEVLSPSGSWEPLNPEKTYNILTNSFLVNKEGDGYFWFKKFGKNSNNTYSTFYSILSEYVQNHHEVSPLNPDGRIKIVGKK
jgi:5'-nucleotidase